MSFVLSSAAFFSFSRQGQHLPGQLSHPFLKWYCCSFTLHGKFSLHSLQLSCWCSHFGASLILLEDVFTLVGVSTFSLTLPIHCNSPGFSFCLFASTVGSLGGEDVFSASLLLSNSSSSLITLLRSSLSLLMSTASLVVFSLLVGFVPSSLMFSSIELLC